MGRCPLAKGRPGSGGAAATGLRVAILAPGRRDNGSGDGFGHHLGCAVSDLDFAGVETAGIEGKSRVFR
ncbi:hypothetical protein CDL15_Pgr004842 [Punica granatum]|uniref:Uncharacterized protein n=1 Tax=Punica granatum TaxID=22663 RepID=A0A218W7R6_PUNGR|nr:hypothetical protein CDL15_Pgr004842 [Punica granatum]